MKDPIERQAAIDAVLSACKDTKTTECAVRELEELPSAQPDLAQLLAYECGKASAQLDNDKQELIRAITAGIVATNTKDVYSCGMRNGMRWCRGLLEEDAPKFEDASLYAQPERKKGEWVWVDTEDEYGWKCSECGYLVDGYRGDTSKFCPNCGCEMVR